MFCLHSITDKWIGRYLESRLIEIYVVAPFDIDDKNC